MEEKRQVPSLPSRSGAPLKHSCSVSFSYFFSFHMVYFAFHSFHNCLILFKDSVEIQEKNNLKIRVLLFLECNLLNSRIDFSRLPWVFVKCDVARGLYTLTNSILLQSPTPLGELFQGYFEYLV